ncbi:unnamed protein product [Cuscuta europaea]|uniref:Uncharacterized protein n=1 Tax=Cuscuta europaea TaxID=41803 RepID=A0A9P0YIQ3_CUSEU|nr:unnamed protein product [Cuscuta europaea]
MLNGLNTLNLNYTQLSEEVGHYREKVGHYREEQRQSFERIEKNQHRIYGPVFIYFNQQGLFSIFSTPPPPPTCYDPTCWGNFGGSSSGGDGHGGGDYGGVSGDFGGRNGSYGGSSDMNEDEYPYAGGFHDSYYGHGGSFEGGDAGGH